MASIGVHSHTAHHKKRTKNQGSGRRHRRVQSHYDQNQDAHQAARRIVSRAMPYVYKFLKYAFAYGLAYLIVHYFIFK